MLLFELITTNGMLQQPGKEVIEPEAVGDWGGVAELLAFDVDDVVSNLAKRRHRWFKLPVYLQHTVAEVLALGSSDLDLGQSTEHDDSLR